MSAMLEVPVSKTIALGSIVLCLKKTVQNAAFGYAPLLQCLG